MDEHKLHNGHDNVISEPIVSYRTGFSIEEEAYRMPTDLLSIAAKTALKEYRAGQCIPHEVIIESVRKEMGWNRLI